MTPEEWRARFQARDQQDLEALGKRMGFTDEYARRRALGLRVWVPLKTIDKLYGRGTMTGHRPKSYADSFFDPNDRSNLFESEQAIEAFARDLLRHGVVLERFERGWRVQSAAAPAKPPGAEPTGAKARQSRPARTGTRPRWRPERD